MVARIATVAFEGTSVLDIDAQVQMSVGVICFTLVGPLDKAVAESRERVRAALFALGLALSAKHIAVNLAPANALKVSSHFDRPIVLALLSAMGVLPLEEVRNYTAVGEFGRVLLTQAAKQMKLTARGYHRVLRVAPTLADLTGTCALMHIHIAEALIYRRLNVGH